MRTARRFARLLLLLLHIALGVVLTVLLTRPRQTAPSALFDAIAGWWRARIARIVGVRVQTRGRPLDGPALLVSNHISWLDIAVLGGIAPLSFLSKSEVRHWPILGWLAARGGTLFIRRGAREAADNAAEQITWHLIRGRKVLLFPEGTTGDGSTVRTFHPRLFSAAVLADVLIQPVALRYTKPQGQPRGTPHPTAPFIGDDTFPAHLWRVLAEPCIVAEVTFLPPIHAQGEDRKTLARHARESIARRLDGNVAAQGETAT
ncbi:lysophospholipid acyltransferase family protein [Acidihalobacter ferrooxydans]|uniref:Phospholipid/glycerol acyltransferase domain-containing protein n=1 Tax=Acidihalobacter ferrooxydans TaxID=1765967 RepID=A0A1P8UIS0_9GAMM|nr:lysophospholipid acyltransferase family protein [Acidihalobacter ferrooxydans]APZ43704.1 hypothetical protein BW247_11880 [Acidihalobacter ferrooxydans]